MQLSSPPYVCYFPRDIISSENFLFGVRIVVLKGKCAIQSYSQIFGCPDSTGAIAAPLALSCGSSEGPD